MSIQQIQALWVCFYIVWWLTLFSSFLIFFNLIHRSYWGDIIIHVNAFVLVLNGEDFRGNNISLKYRWRLVLIWKIFATQFSCLFADVVVVVDWCICFRRNVYILTKKKINYSQQLVVALQGNLCSQCWYLCLANKIKAIDVSQIW